MTFKRVVPQLLACALLPSVACVDSQGAPTEVGESKLNTTGTLDPSGPGKRYECSTVEGQYSSYRANVTTHRKDGEVFIDVSYFRPGYPDYVINYLNKEVRETFSPTGEVVYKAGRSTKVVIDPVGGRGTLSDVDIRHGAPVSLTSCRVISPPYLTHPTCVVRVPLTNPVRDDERYKRQGRVVDMLNRKGYRAYHEYLNLDDTDMPSIYDDRHQFYKGNDLLAYSGTGGSCTFILKIAKTVAESLYESSVFESSQESTTCADAEARVEELLPQCVVRP